jgi:serine/threonine protein kinase
MFRSPAKGDEREFSMRDLGGTPLYLSPEQKNLNGNSRRDQLCDLPREKVDIYAAGLVLFEMCGQFRTQMERCINIDNLSRNRTLPKGFKEKFYQESKVIMLMTEVIPEKRPSAAQFLDRSPEH